MASYKLFWCLITFTVASALPQPRRSSSSSSSFKLGNSPGFRFGEEYFAPEATEDAPERHSKPDGCEKVLKDSMVCMVCKDPETSAKYEQCSYVPRKTDKHYSYSRSSDKKKPSHYEGSQSRVSEAYPSRKDSRESRESKESREAEASSPYSSYYDSKKDSQESQETRINPRRSYDDSSSREYTSESERIAKQATKDKCVEEKRDDGMTCMVCADPNTGGNFEKCAYAYEPSDKVYKYSKSKSFDYPHDKSSKTKSPKKAIRRIDDEDHDDKERFEESKVSEKKIGDHCKEVVKDSMTCTVCTDPKSGKNSENCSYSYDPADKLYTYSQSRSFGNPSKGSKE